MDVGTLWGTIASLSAEIEAKTAWVVPNSLQVLAADFHAGAFGAAGGRDATYLRLGRGRESGKQEDSAASQLRSANPMDTPVGRQFLSSSFGFRVRGDEGIL